MTRTRLPKVVLLTGGALLALWALSFGLSYLNLGGGALPVAIGVAALKAGLVVVFFMELLQERTSTKLAVSAACVLLGTLIGFVVADIVTREPAPLSPYGAER
jgi:cytochrome c oxidase subunit 4